MASSTHARMLEVERSDRGAGELLTSVGRSTWQRAYATSLVASDAIILILLSLLAGSLSTGSLALRPLSLLFALAFTAGWVGSLAVEGAYDVRFLGAGAQEYQRVAQASFKYAALLAIIVVAVGSQPAREVAALVMVCGLLLLLVGRKVARGVLHKRRAASDCVFRVLAVGDRAYVSRLVSALRRSPAAGFQVVGVCTSGASKEPIDGVPVVGAFHEARAAAEGLGADVIAVTASAEVHHDDVKALGWSLEGSGIHLVLAPSLTDIAGPRISVHPVSGLPFIYVDEPDLGVVRSVVKGLIDRLVAGVALALTLPAMLVIAALIKLDSPGPVIFKQRRVGKDGNVIQVWKFRSMEVGSETLIHTLAGSNETDGLLFKVKADPRVTRVGAWLRQWSLDELPQLVNVMAGNMSLIGPRPLPVSPESFQGSERRRLLVKPGITGLWQVSGRSNTTWDEAIRLDLYYVENWSLWLDLVILARTISTVLSRRGAY